MAVTVYKSTDGSAPSLTGQVDSLCALLNAVLVTGYGAKAAAGWTRPFDGTNASSFRMTTTGASGFYIDVDDTGPDAAAGAREARVRGFETMSALATGTGRFPSGNLFVIKSETADATARPWVIVADDKTFHLFIKPGGTTGPWYSFSFGDFYSLKTGDAYRCAIIGRSVTHTPGAVNLTDENMQVLNPTVADAAPGHWLPRNWLGAAASATNVGKHCGDQAKRKLVPYPNPADGSMMLAQIWLHEDAGNLGVVRGRLRGIWDQLHPDSLAVADQDTFSGSGALSGKSFLILKPGAGDGAIQTFILETSNTWETSS